MKENLAFIKECLFDAPVEVKAAYNEVVKYFDKRLEGKSLENITLGEYLGDFTIEEFYEKYKPEETKEFLNSIKGLKKASFFKAEVQDDYETGEWHRTYIAISAKKKSQLLKEIKSKENVKKYVDSIKTPEEFLMLLRAVLYKAIDDSKYSSIDRDINHILLEASNSMRYRRGWRQDVVDFY